MKISNEIKNALTNLKDVRLKFRHDAVKNIRYYLEVDTITDKEGKDAVMIKLTEVENNIKNYKQKNQWETYIEINVISVLDKDDLGISWLKHFSNPKRYSIRQRIDMTVGNIDYQGGRAFCDDLEKIYHIWLLLKKGHTLDDDFYFVNGDEIDELEKRLVK